MKVFYAGLSLLFGVLIINSYLGPIAAVGILFVVLSLTIMFGVK